MGQNTKALQTSYDRVAAEYVERYLNELEHKPFDCELLDRFAESVRGQGPVCDMGCGPGQIARYLYECGVDVLGVDLSPGMVEQAQRLSPHIEFRQGDMFELDVPDGAWAGIAAFYSIIHIPREDVVGALRELARVLQPGGLLLLTFHIGEETLHLDELWGKEVSMDTTFFQRAEIEGYLSSAGFEIENAVERPPYEGVEYQSHRAYIFARKPI
jgi:SAM-dependent methyltransferase